MPAPTYKELLDLDLKEAKKLVKNYDGPDKGKFARKVSCVVRCRKPTEENIGKYVNSLKSYSGDEHVRERELLRETATQILHLYLLSTDDFPPSREYVALSCIYIASKTKDDLLDLTQSKLSNVRYSEESKFLTNAFNPAFGKYIKSVIRSILSNYTNLENVETVIDEFNNSSIHGLMFDLIDKVRDNYSELVVPCSTSKVEKIDVSNYDKKIESFLYQRQVLDELKEDPKFSAILTCNHKLKKTIWNFIKERCNLFEKPVTFCFKRNKKYMSRLEEIGLVEYDPGKKAWELKDEELMEKIKILAEQD